MPKTIDGKSLTDKEHRQWRHIFVSGGRTEKAAKMATAAVQKGRA